MRYVGAPNVSAKSNAEKCLILFADSSKCFEVKNMTLTPEQIKEAVELADGFQLSLQGTWIECLEWSSCSCSVGLIPDYVISYLASQLISQVDAIRGFRLIQCESWTTIRDTYKFVVVIEIEGPNRDENSILACTEFLREKSGE